MRRVYSTVDFSEAHVVEAMLNGAGVGAHILDRNMVRQDWFQTLAFGGYRVMVEDADSENAKALIDDYRSGALAIDEAVTDRPACPRCGTPGQEDPFPRRLVFAWLIFADLLAVAALMVAERAREYGLPILLVANLVGVPVLAIVVSRWLKSRYRCVACSACWRARPVPHAEAAREVEAAASSDKTP
jgi:hypothetical protein